MTFKKLIFTQIFISAILASPAPQIGGLGFGVLGGGGGTSRGHRGGFDREATTGLLNGGIGAANGLVKVGSAQEAIVEERVVEAPAPQETQQSEVEAEEEHEFADTRASQIHPHISPEEELFLEHSHFSPEEELFLEREAHLFHEEPAEHFHEEITIEEKPHEPIIVEHKPERFDFEGFMPEFAKSFFSDESA
jgi:hypothetical protein